MEIIFWISLSFIFYTYLGYPILVYLWSIGFIKEVEKEDIRPEPAVSVVIAARNQEKNIEERIRNLLEQDYPRDKLEIIVVSDGSNDNTNIVIQQLARELSDELSGRDEILKLLYRSRSHGKAGALNTGVDQAKGEIIVFADCRQRYSKDAIKQLVSNFSDKKVGCVSGELLFEETPGSSIQPEMGAYWNFEKWLRKVESKTGSVPGATGAIYAIRKNLFRPLPEKTLLDDVLIPLNICMQGFRTIFDSNALAYDVVSKDLSQEKKRKVRTLAGNWQLLILQPRLLNPLYNPLWFKFLSHKIFRLLIPYCFILLLATSLYLLSLLSIFVSILLVLFIILALIPPLPDDFGILSKCSRICKSVFFLNYFAFLAPFGLIGSSKKLW